MDEVRERRWTNLTSTSSSDEIILRNLIYESFPSKQEVESSNSRVDVRSIKRNVGRC